MVFTGKPRSHLAEHPHEPGVLSFMNIPLIILAVFALGFGIIAQSGFYEFLSKTFTTNTAYMDALNFEHLAEIGGNVIPHGHANLPFFIIWLPTVLALSGIGIAGFVYYNNRIDVGKYITKDNPIYRILWNKYYLDYLYKDVIAEKFYITLMTFWDAFDLYVIDGVVNGISWITVRTGGIVRKVQTGVIQSYATSVMLGIVALILALKIWGVA
jgi:NADH-quinone oxidoreductase subunit L